MKEGVNKERKRARKEWYGKNWKWVVPCIVAGLILAIVLCSISIPFIVFKLQQSTFFHLKLCVGFSIRKGMTKMVVPSNRCNSKKIKVLDFRVFPQLKSIEIGDECFMYVDEVKLIGLNRLERVMIGKNCFTKKKNDWGNDPTRHFHLKNCERVRELKIGRGSFSDYSVCEIENVPSLEVIEMGQLNEDSYNFRYASLELKSDYQRMK